MIYLYNWNHMFAVSYMHLTSVDSYCAKVWWLAIVNSLPIFCYMNVSQSVWLLGWYWGCFQFFVVISNVNMNIFVQVSPLGVHTYAVLLNIYLGTEWLGHKESVQLEQIMPDSIPRWLCQFTLDSTVWELPFFPHRQ